MEKKEVFGLREGEEVFISWKNEREEIISGFAILISISDNLITFQTKQNRVTIPMNRVLKIKQRNGS